MSKTNPPLPFVGGLKGPNERSNPSPFTPPFIYQRCCFLGPAVINQALICKKCKKAKVFPISNIRLPWAPPRRCSLHARHGMIRHRDSPQDFSDGGSLALEIKSKFLSRPRDPPGWELPIPLASICFFKPSSHPTDLSVPLNTSQLWAPAFICCSLSFKHPELRLSGAGSFLSFRFYFKHWLSLQHGPIRSLLTIFFPIILFYIPHVLSRTIFACLRCQYQNLPNGVLTPLCCIPWGLV